MLTQIRHPMIVIGLIALSGAALAGESTPITLRAETEHYRLELDIGALERMYTKMEAAKLHPKSGEIMVRGTMVGMPMGGDKPMAAMAGANSDKPMAMPMPGAAAGTGVQGWRHLEVHVISKTTGKPVRDARLEIAVTNTATRRHFAVPIAVMYGVQEGVSDWHYGNNVMLPAGPYRIDVTVNTEQAAFAVAVPAY